MSAFGLPHRAQTSLRTSADGLRLDRAHLPGLARALEGARQCLFSMQQPDGHWVGELQGDTILESEYVLLMAFLGRENEQRVLKAAQYISDQQLSEGGWNNYPDGPVEVSV